jgi:hypothetical protein
VIHALLIDEVLVLKVTQLLRSALWLSLFAIASPSFAQNITPQTMIDDLTPTSDRGVKPLHPDCKKFHDDATRGVELVPKADLALKVEFETGSDRLTPDAATVLDKLGAALNSPKLNGVLLRDCGTHRFDRAGIL